jgi:NADH-quinone oxidoreductase subunit E
MMTDVKQKLLTQMLSKEGIQELDRWIAKYPDDQKQSAVMQGLMLVQEQHGYLTQELMDAVAEYLDMPVIAVYEVATFYSMYELKPVGKNCINVCTNISCQLRGSHQVVEHLEKKLGIKLGKTTEDGRFTLRSVECLGACADAPMMQVNKDYYENLTPEKIDQIIGQCD